MTKTDIIRKLTSRKLWMALAGLISGLILAFNGDAATAATVSGITLPVASVSGYLAAEGLADAASAKADVIVEGIAVTEEVE